jgi:hypothetical protein
MVTNGFHSRPDVTVGFVVCLGLPWSAYFLAASAPTRRDNLSATMSTANVRVFCRR